MVDPLLPSVKLVSAIEMVGATSSSVIVTVWVWVPLSVAPSPPLTPVISTMMVSSTSSRVSCTAVMVAVPVVCPAAIVIVVDERV